MSQYIVSFRGGTSGRFIANIMWMMLNDLSTELTFTPENSAHNNNPWDKTWEILEPLSAPGGYTNWKFKVPDGGLVPTHKYPDFKVIRETVPNARFVIITCTDNDLVEIATNMVHKNYIPSCTKFIKTNDKEQFLKEIWKPDYDMYHVEHLKMYNKIMAINSDLLNNREFVDTMVYLKLDYDNSKIKNTPHKVNDTIIRESDADVLYIKYEDIFKEAESSFVALNQLRDFIKPDNSNETNNAIANTYLRYLTNRAEFLKNNLPILTYDEYQIRKNATLVPRYGRSPS